MAEKITIRVSFDQTAISMGIIGRVGENISRQILFDCTSAMTGRTSASIVCVVKRPPDSDPYPVSLTRVGSTDVYRLVLSSAEVAFAGTVQFELRMLDGSEILKAAICTGTVENSLTGIADEPGAAIPDALNRLEQAVKDAEKVVPATEAAIAAADAANAAAKSAAATRPDWDKNDSTLSGYILNRTHSRTKQTIDCTQNLGTTDGWQKVSSSYIKKSFEHSSGAASPYEPSVTVVEGGVESELSLRWGVNWFDGSAAMDEFWEYDSHFEEHLPGYINKGYKRTYGFYGTSIVGMGGTKVVMIVHREVDGFTPGTYINPSEISPKTFKTISWYDVSPIADEYIPDTIARKDGLPDLDMTLTDSNGAAHAATVGKRFEATEAKLKRESAEPIILTAAGEGTASVLGSADRPLTGVRLYGKTTQGGIPSEGKPQEFANAGAGGSVKVDVRGKNLFDASALSHATSSHTGDETLLVLTQSANYGTATYSLRAEPNTTYTVSFRLAAVAEGHPFLYSFAVGDDAYQTTSATGMVTASCTTSDAGGTLYLKLRPTGSSGVTGSATLQNVMLEAASAATEFEPCKNISMSVPTSNGLPGIRVVGSDTFNYTDSHGDQWICDEIDLEHGVYVKRVAVLALSAAYTWNTSGSALYRHFSEAANQPSAEIAGVSTWCIRCTHLNGDTPASLAAGESYGIGYGNGSSKSIYIRTIDLRTSSDITTSEQLNAWISKYEPQVMYPLATPVEIALPSSVLYAFGQMLSRKPATTIFNDAGIGMEMKCIADTRTYIDNKLADIAASGGGSASGGSASLTVDANGNATF